VACSLIYVFFEFENDADLKGKPNDATMTAVGAAERCARSNNYGVLLNNVKSTNKDSTTSSTPSSSLVPHTCLLPSSGQATPSLTTSVDDCARTY
jgi:hypothetical protein